MKKGFIALIAAALIILFALLALFMATRNAQQGDAQSSNDVPLISIGDNDASVSVLSEDEQQIRKYDKQSATELLLEDEQLCSYIDVTNEENIGFEDITTNEVYARANAQIFKASNQYESFIIADDVMYHIARADGAFGISYIDVCDFDDNSIMDVIYVYSYHDDVFTVEIAYFDMVLKTENILYKYESPQGYSELILEKLSGGIFDVYTTVADNTEDENVSFVKDKKIAEISAGMAMDYYPEYDGEEWVE